MASAACTHSILPHETKIYLISGSHKPQVRLCNNSITDMASEWFVEKKEGRSKGALSARCGGLLEVSIRERKQQDLVLKEGKRVVRERG